MTYELHCKADHDALVVLSTRFVEYREAMELRLEKLNELRGQVESDRGLYLRTDVYSAESEALKKRLSACELWQSKIMGVGIAVGALLALVGAFVGHGWK